MHKLGICGCAITIAGLTAISPVQAKGPDDKWFQKVCEAMMDPKQRSHCFKVLEEDRAKRKQSDQLYEESERRQQQERAADEQAQWYANNKDKLYGECGNDLDCWVKEKSDKLQDLDAQVSCKRMVEAHAKYQFKWVDGWGESKFPRYYGLDQEKYPFVVGYAGDAVQFQNGFSAWRPYSYRCWYDYGSKQVLKVDMKEGKGQY